VSDGLDIDELADRYPSVDEIAGQGDDAPEPVAAPSFMGCRRWFWQTPLPSSPTRGEVSACERGTIGVHTRSTPPPSVGEDGRGATGSHQLSS
jgi:hypothetical protein